MHYSRYARCMPIVGRYVLCILHVPDIFVSNWTSLANIRQLTSCIFKFINLVVCVLLCNFSAIPADVLPGDVPIRSETCKSGMFLNIFCYEPVMIKWICWRTMKNRIIMHSIENIKNRDFDL